MSDPSVKSMPSRKFKSLGIRLFSGIALILFCGFPVYYGGWAIILLAGLFGAGMIREWVRMTDPQAPMLAMVIPVFALWIALALAVSGQWTWALILMGLSGFVAMGERLKRGGVLWAGFGTWYIILPCLAFVWLRGDVTGFDSKGFAQLMFVLVVVIAADSFAYLGGSLLKGPKLAPTISPNKTWSGFFSGLAFGVILGMIAAKLIGFDILLGLGLAVPIVIASVFGDLLESAIKRHLKVKDAGDLLPGHGGLLDRLDSVMLAVIVAAFVLLMWPGIWLG